jgi:cyclopropane-fatty-acyl-phospholipid synthase
MIEPAGVRLELWDGSSSYAGTREPIGELLIGDRRTLVGLAFNPDVWFGESYMTGGLGVRGPLEPVIEALTANAPTNASWLQRLKIALPRRNSLRHARHNVHQHYDLGNPFYQLWLDRELVYTCAYFETPEMSLEDAQRAKHDLVCRKLRLRPGETVVEAGCGWGALAVHMARHYGVQVKAFNVSREQLSYARERASREGLTDRIEFIDDDYRNVAGEFDAFVSVGMLEHVGLPHYHSFAEVLSHCLKRNGGRGLLHFIGRDMPRPLNAWISRRIFPGAYPPTLAEVTKCILAPAGMSVIARALERSFRCCERSGPRDLRRGLPPRVGVVPRRLTGGVRDRLHAAVSGAVRTARVATTDMDTG